MAVAIVYVKLSTTGPRPHFAHRDFQKKSVSKNKLATAPNRRNAPLKIQNVAATWRIFVRMWRIFVRMWHATVVLAEY